MSTTDPSLLTGGEPTELNTIPHSPPNVHLYATNPTNARDSSRSASSTVCPCSRLFSTAIPPLILSMWKIERSRHVGAFSADKMRSHEVKSMVRIPNIQASLLNYRVRNLHRLLPYNGVVPPSTGGN